MKKHTHTWLAKNAETVAISNWFSSDGINFNNRYRINGRENLGNKSDGTDGIIRIYWGGKKLLVTF